MRSRLLVLLVWLLTPHAHAQIPEKESRWIVIVENDAFGIPNSDRNYTMGMAFVRLQNGMPDTGGSRIALRGLAWFNDLVRIETSGPSVQLPTWSTMGSTNFTPNQLTVSAPIPDDRPYSSLIYLGTGYSQTKGNYTIETEFQIGVLGTSVGEFVQTEIHEVCCKHKIPQGWDNQIGDGGSPTFLYGARMSRTLAQPLLFDAFPAELRATAGGEVGYYVRGLGELSLTVGGSWPDLRNLGAGGMTRGLRPYGADATLARPPISVAAKRETTGFSAWLNYELSAFAYNQLLQGAWFGDNKVTIDRDDMETFVHHVSFGLELSFLFRAIGLFRESHVYWTQHWRSKDIDTALGTHQRYGGLTFLWD